ncbi:glucose 1-dehydrogenase [Myxococcota bacterium]|nr:glucose 1-dehydrogenase [Myxococcota bacterium]
MGQLDGKVAVITGAARGQGEAEARLFVEEGARVVLGDVLDDLGKQVAESLGDAAVYAHHDVSDSTSWSEMIATAESAFGKVDVLVNNAGILRVGMIADMTVEEYQQVIAINQTGVFLGMQSVLPAMQKAGGGSIVNISSIGGFAGVAGMSAYVASKFAVRGMTKCAAIEFGPHNIRVNSVHPGGVDTPMLHPLDGAERAQAAGTTMYDSVPLGRISEPAEIGNLVVFLASDAASYCTGSEFIADGGMLSRIAMG